MFIKYQLNAFREHNKNFLEPYVYFNASKNGFSENIDSIYDR